MANNGVSLDALYGQINCGRGRVEGGGRWEVGFDIIGGVPMN